jgi:hypothetical protein
VQMPALNTPQFNWVKSRLARKAQPVPPIFQPEIAADAIVWASHHRRREIFVGLPTVKAILANRIAPGLLDHYLARTGYDAQQHNGAPDPNAANNLWEPAPGHYSAHGDFNQGARSRSLQLWMTKHRFPLMAVAIGALAVATTFLYDDAD